MAATRQKSLASERAEGKYWPRNLRTRSEVMCDRPAGPALAVEALAFAEDDEQQRQLRVLQRDGHQGARPEAVPVEAGYGYPQDENAPEDQVEHHPEGGAGVAWLQYPLAHEKAA
jgi:hypothetical protein